MGDLIPLFHEEDNWPGDDPELEDDDSPPDKAIRAEPIDPVRGVDCNGAVGGGEADVY